VLWGMAALLPSRRYGAAGARRRCCHPGGTVLPGHGNAAAIAETRCCKPRPSELQSTMPLSSPATAVISLHRGKEELLPGEGGGATDCGVGCVAATYKKCAPALQGGAAMLLARFLAGLIHVARQRWRCGGVSCSRSLVSVWGIS
jgi:hypothetical protein